MVYKGCQRRMIVMKSTGSELFDEAYFLLKDRTERLEISESDMVREAARIIDENLLSSCRPTQSRPQLGDSVKRLLWYAAGVLTCAAVSGLIALV